MKYVPLPSDDSPPEPFDGQVGYTIRFEDVSDKERTRIKYLTDGMLSGSENISSTFCSMV
jgi:hypothetical protein